MEYIVIGLVSAFNLLIIKVKLEKKRFADAFFDLALMCVLAFLFAGTYGGMVVAMVGSLAVSLYLLASPPKFTSVGLDKLKKEFDYIQELNGFTPKKKNPLDDFDV
jgi:hypothetical protein